jgi:starch synthase (maltosyl-transferring)
MRTRLRERFGLRLLPFRMALRPKTESCAKLLATAACTAVCISAPQPFFPTFSFDHPRPSATLFPMDRHPYPVIIENVSPAINGGRFPVKRVVGEELRVEADIYKDGHDIVGARLKWREQGKRKWNTAPMTAIPNGNDRWQGSCTLLQNATFEITIEAWPDTFRSWSHEFRTKLRAGQTDLSLETKEGVLLIEAAAERAQKTSPDSTKTLREKAGELANSAPSQADTLAHEPALESLMDAFADLELATEWTLDLCEVRALVDAPPLRKSSSSRYPLVVVDRREALCAAWYEFFPRSATGESHRGATFRECLPRVEDAKSMGFNVIYFPPIHPIGVTARKGRNNSLTCEPGEPGVPYAIGNRNQNCPNGGGHRDVAPELGTLDDFTWLVEEIRARGMEVALDFAINCSPDHPYVHEHPDWFFKRPDGSIKYAENPPKKYQDVYPLNFHNPDWRNLWKELTDVVRFWCTKGVRIFRVDNPHTKPVALWEYMISTLQSEYPDAIFLSEAFTRPKMMHVLAKAGFTQSYTYFTWRNSPAELRDYFTELTTTAQAEVFRPNLWPNTPDILPFFLQTGGRPAFEIRAILASTLSPVYGIYSGFELCENAAVPNKEEYLDSEKYQWKQRDWNAPGNIKDLFRKLNSFRDSHPELQQLRNLRFLRSDNPNILAFAKFSDDSPTLTLVVVTLDPFHTQSGLIETPSDLLRRNPNEGFDVRDAITNQTFHWQGHQNFVEFRPGEVVGHLLEIRR